MASSSGSPGPAESPSTPAAVAAPPVVRDPSEIFDRWVSACQDIIARYMRSAYSNNAYLDYGDIRAATRDNLVNLAREYIDLLRNQESAGDGARAENQRPLESDYVANIRVYRSYLIHVWAGENEGAPFLPIHPHDDF